MDLLFDVIHKNSDRLARAIILLMIVYMGWSVSSAILFFFEYSGNTSSALIEDANIIAEPSDRSVHVELSLLNLFGSVENASQGSTTNQGINAPATRLNLELQGVFKADIKDASTAIIAEKNKKGILYGIGDSLPGNAKLFDIFDDHILIKRGNAVEKLMFEEYAKGTASSFNPTQGLKSQASLSRPMQPTQAMQRGADGRGRFSSTIRGTPSSQDNTNSRIEEYKNRFESDPSSVLAEFGLNSVNESSAEGYEIQSGLASSYLKRSGLKEGDIILSVNGKPVGNTATDSSLIDQSRGAKRLRIEVKRGSRKFFITVPVKY